MRFRRIPRWLRDARDRARTVACCPTCQVEPGIPCHTNGWALDGGAVHARRYQEAEGGRRMNATPIEARCDHCKQTRPLFLYEPDHGHLGAGMFTCRWCTREKQPLLCVRCWDKEAELEENDLSINEDAETMRQICEQNARNEARREAREAAERDALDGIAAATERAETGS